MSHVLIFSPFANHFEHSELDHFFANELVRNGDRVTVVRCSRALRPKCVGMGLLSKSDASQELECVSCTQRAKNLQRRAKYETTQLESFLGKQSFRQAQDALLGINPKKWRDFEFDGIPFGKMWSYETAIHFKTSQLELQQEALDEFWSLARGNLLTYLAIREMREKLAPDVGMVFNFEYSANRSFVLGLSGKPCYSISLGWGSQRYATVKVSGAEKLWDIYDDEKLPASLDTSLSGREIQEITRTVRQSIRGTNIFSYSKPPQSKLGKRDVYFALGLDPLKPTVAVLLSSPDELDSGNLAALRSSHRAFDDELEVIRLMTQVAQDHPELQFVFRLHPRLLPDRRVNATSDSLNQILELIPRLKNVRVNSPTDKVGLWDLVKITDVAVSTRSSSAWEFGFLGVPVLYSDPGRDLNNFEGLLGKRIGAATYTKNHFDRLLIRALSGSEDHSTKSSRFLAHLTMRSHTQLYQNYLSRLAEKLLSVHRKVLLTLIRGGRKLVGPRLFSDQFRRLENEAFRFRAPARVPYVGLYPAEELLEKLTEGTSLLQPSYREQARLAAARQKLWRELKFR